MCQLHYSIKINFVHVRLESCTFSFLYFLSVELYLYYGTSTATEIDDWLWRRQCEEFVIVPKKQYQETDIVHGGIREI